MPRLDVIRFLVTDFQDQLPNCQFHGQTLKIICITTLIAEETHQASTGVVSISEFADFGSQIRNVYRV